MEHHDDEHKSVQSTLERFDYRMVSQFPLDAMHLVDLGVGKQVFKSFILQVTAGSRRKCDERTLSELYCTYSKNTPSEFSRKPRSLDEVPRFKATEFRQFVLYTGVVFLKDFLSHRAYCHFLCLSLGYRLLFSKVPVLTVAQDLLEMFVSRFTQFYKDSSLSYNVHSLLHLVEDVELHGPVDNFSAYKFENCIRILGNLIRKTSAELQQVYNRIHEYNYCNRKIGPKSERRVKIDSTVRNGFLLLANNKFVRVLSVRDNNFIVREFLEPKCFLPSPFDTLNFNIVSVDKSIISQEEYQISREEVVSKLYCLPYQNNLVLIPML